MRWKDGAFGDTDTKETTEKDFLSKETSSTISYFSSIYFTIFYINVVFIDTYYAIYLNTKFCPSNLCLRCNNNGCCPFKKCETTICSGGQSEAS